MQRWTGTIAGLAFAALATLAQAGEAQDRLFATGVLDAVAPDTRLVYDYTRQGQFESPAVEPIADGSLTLAIVDAAEDGRAAQVTLDAAARSSEFAPFPADAGNPVFLIFLEESVRVMSALTGGSPFYIRNRMREALGTAGEVEPVEVEAGGETVEATRLSFRPFAEDPNAARMQGFAGLTLTFVMSDAVPGAFVSLEAVAPAKDAGAALLEQTITFDRVEG